MNTKKTGGGISILPSLRTRKFQNGLNLRPMEQQSSVSGGMKTAFFMKTQPIGEPKLRTPAFLKRMLSVATNLKSNISTLTIGIPKGKPYVFTGVVATLIRIKIKIRTEGHFQSMLFHPIVQKGEVL